MCEHFKCACTTDPDFDVQTLPAASLVPGGGSQNVIPGVVAVVAVGALASQSCNKCATNCNTCIVKITHIKTNIKSMFAAIP